MVARCIKRLEAVAGKEKNSVERLGQFMADTGCHLTQAGKPTRVEQLLLPFLHLGHQFKKIAAVSADQHVQHSAVLGDMGRTAHLDRQHGSALGAKLGLKLLRLLVDQSPTDGLSLFGVEQIVQGKGPLGKRRIAGPLQEFSVGLNDHKILVQEQKKLGDARENALGKIPAGFHFLVFFENTDNQILPLPFQYLYCLVRHPFPFVTEIAQTIPEGQVSVTNFIHCGNTHKLSMLADKLFSAVTIFTHKPWLPLRILAGSNPDPSI